MRVCALLFCLILPITVVAAQAPAEDAGRAAFDKAVEAYNNRNFEQAKTQFAEALAAYPGNATVLTWLGTTCYELKQWDEAIDNLTKATQADPKYAVAFNNLGNAYLEKGTEVMKGGNDKDGRALLEKAVAAYQTAIGLDEKYFYPRYNLAITYTRMKEWDKAWKAYTDATKVKPDDPDVWKSFGRALKEAGEYDKAIERYGKAGELDAKCVECAVQLGWLNSKLAHWPDAEQAYQRAIALEADNFDAQLGLGIALYAERKYAEARAPLTRASELHADSFEARYDLGLTEDALNNLAPAETAYRAALALKPNDVPCLNNLGVVLYKQDKACDAVPQFRAAVAADATYVMAQTNLALALDACGKDDQAALDQWKAVVKAFPRQASAQCGLANALYRRKDLDGALASYLRCLELDDQNVEAHDNVGLIFLEKNQFAEAIAHFRRALQIDSKNLAALNNLGVTYEKQNNPTEARKYYEQALQIDPNCQRAKENLDRLKGAGGGH